MKKTMGKSRSLLRRLLALSLVFALLLPAGMAGTVGAAEPDAALTEMDPSSRAPATSLQLSSDGTEIKAYTERKNESLKWIKIPYGVKEIGQNAFGGANFLEKIIIPDSVTYIDKYAFYGCKALREITIPGSVGTIGSSAFGNCTALETVTLLYGVQSIEDSAFMGCTSLSKVTVSPSVKNLPEDDSLFSDSGAPNGIQVETNLKNYEKPAEDAAIIDYLKDIGSPEAINVSKLSGDSPAAYDYKSDANGEVTITGYYGEDTDIKVPETINGGEVTQIGDGKNPVQGTPITDVELPETVRTIGSNAFAGCTSLKFVIIPDSVTSIGNDAFSNVTSLTLSGSCKALWQFLRERRLIRFIPRGAGMNSFHRVTAKVTTTEGAWTDGGTLTEGDSDNYFMEGEELSYTVQLKTLDPKLGRYEFKGWTITPAMNIQGVSEAELLKQILGTKSEDETKSALAERSITIMVPKVNITLTAEIEFNPTPKPDPYIIDARWSGDGSEQTSTILQEYFGAGSIDGKLLVGTFEVDGKQKVVTKIGQANGSGGMGFTNPDTQEITIGSTVDGILPQAFIKATGLQKIIVEDGNAQFTAIDGVLFSKKGDKLLKLLAYPASKPGASYKVPDGVEEIGAYAFYNCKNLTSIDFNNVKKIGAHAFTRCGGLTSIDTKNVTEIGAYAFYNCNNLASINTEYVTKIGDYAFSSAKLEKVIMPHIVTIGNHAFEGASCLERIQFAESLESLGSYCFNNCGNLTHIEWAAPDKIKGNKITSIPTRAFAGSNLSTLTLPKSENGITIDAYAFANSMVEQIIISKSIESIASTAFSGCSRLKEYKMETDNNGVEIPNEKYTCIDGVLFSKRKKPEDLEHPLTLMAYPTAKTTISGEENAKTYTVPDEVVEIANGAFEQAKFETIKLSEKTKVIGSEAFMHSNLKGIDLTNVTSISTSVFQSCQNLEEITWPSGINTIGYGTFCNCWNLKKVTAPNVTTIDSYAFYRCSKLTDAPLHNNVTSIGSSAFSYCDSLTEANIPNVVFSGTEDSVFRSCKALKAVYVGSPCIPENAFRDCSALETLGLVSSSVEEIAASAFQGCSSLKKTTGAKTTEAADETKDPVMDLSNVGTIASHAFSSCRSITNLKTGGDQIGAYAFSDCTGLVTAQIGTKSIGDGATESYAFSGCTSLSDLTLADVVTIGKMAFSGCSALTKVNIPVSLTTLGERAFINCSNLASVTVDDGNLNFDDRDGVPEGTQGKAAVGSVLYATKSNTLYLYPQARTGETYTVIDNVNIQDYAFEGAKYLTRVNIGEVVSEKPAGTAVSLGKGIFANCTKLTDVYVYNPEAKFIEEDGEGEYLTTFSMMSDAALRSLTVHGWLGSTADDAAFSMKKKDVGFMPLEEVSDGLIVSLDGSSPEYNGTITGYIGNDTKVIVTSQIDEEFVKTYKNTVLLKDGKIHNLQANESVNVKTVGRKAFWKNEDEKGICESITSIYLPKSITTIKSYAFEDCVALTGTFSIPVGTETIEPYAFYNCKNLLEVLIPENVTVIGEELKDEYAGIQKHSVGMFHGCSGLEKITVDPDNAKFSSIDGVLMSKDGKVIYEAPENLKVTDGSYKIPSKVQVIDCSAFAENKTITTLTIPSSVRVVMQHAFQRAVLTNIVFQDDIMSTDGTNNELNIDNEAFADCNQIVNITFPRWLTKIGVDVFKGCTSLESFSIPNDNNLIFQVHDGALYERVTRKYKVDGREYSEICFELHCVPACMPGDALNTFTIPAEIPNTNGFPVRTIRQSAFQGNKNIKKIIIGGNVEHIMESAFRDCESLNTVEFSDRISEYGVTISGWAFSGTALSEFTLPKCVLSLGEGCFQNCGQLETVTVKNRTMIYDLVSGSDSDKVFETVEKKKIIVSGYAGSTTEKYCNKYGVTFVPLDDGSTAYTIDSSAIVNGSAITSVNIAEKDDEVTFSLTPKNGGNYVLDSKSVRVVPIDGENVGAPLALTRFEDMEGVYYSFKMPARNVSITATFVLQDPYLVVVVENEHANVAASPSRAYESDIVTVTATPHPGYQVDGITASKEDGTPVTVTPAEDGKYTFKMPGGDVKLSASVSKIEEIEKFYEITVAQGVYGVATVDKQSAKKGETVTVEPMITSSQGTSYEISGVKVKCNNGYEFDAIKAENGKYTFEMPADNVTVTPVVPRLFNIEILPYKNGTVNLECHFAKMDDLVKVTMTPDDGYRPILKVWAKNTTGNEVPLVGTDSFEMPESDVKISVKFEAIATMSEKPASAVSK